MKRELLFLLFLLILLDEMLGLGLGILPGLSIKNAFLYFLVFVIIIDAAVTYSEPKIGFVNLNILFALLIIYALISWALHSVFASDSDYDVLGSFMAWKSSLVDHYLFFLVYLYGLRTIDDVRAISSRMVVVILLTVILTLVDVMNIPDLGIVRDREDGRVVGPLGEANQYGSFLIFWLPIAFGFLLTFGKGLKIITVIACLGGLGLLLLTGSRGAILGLVAGSILAAFSLRQFLPPGRMVRAVLLISLLAVMVLVVVDYQYGDILEARIEKTMSDDIDKATSGRTDTWSDAIEYMVAHPQSFLIGNGWATFRIRNPISAHNTYLNMLFDLGAIGLFLFLILLYRIFQEVRRNLFYADEWSRKIVSGYIVGFVSILCSIFFVELAKPWYFFWAYTGLMMRLVLLTEERRLNSVRTIGVGDAESRPDERYD